MYAVYSHTKLNSFKNRNYESWKFVNYYQLRCFRSVQKEEIEEKNDLANRKESTGIKKKTLQHRWKGEKQK